jgi:hypothetical protein
MIFKEDFDKEMLTCEKVKHIEEEITDPTLIEIDKLFGAADDLSKRHCRKHHNNLLFISLITAASYFAFLFMMKQNSTG